jgi:hypothetical protein
MKHLARLSIVLILLAMGCLKMPVMPSWETTLTIPFDERVTVEEISDWFDDFFIDSSGSLWFQFTEEFDPAYIDDNLRADPMDRELVEHMGYLELSDTDVETVGFALQELCPFPLPDSGWVDSIPGFDFDVQEKAITKFTNFTIVDLAVGTANCHIFNEIGMPIESIHLHFRDAISGDHSFEMNFSYIPLGGMVLLENGLAGRTITDSMTVDISGTCSGSMGSPMYVGEDVRLDLETWLDDLLARNGTAVIPPQTVVMDSIMLLEDSLAVDSAWIRTGALDISIHNHLTLDAEYDFIVPGLEDAQGRPFTRHYSLNPGEQSYSSSSLDGYRMVSGRMGNSRYLSYEITGLLDSGGELVDIHYMDSVTALADFSEIIFEEVSGPFGPMDITVPYSTWDFDLSEYGNDISTPTEVSLQMEISNTINMGADLSDLTIFGENEFGHRAVLNVYYPLNVSSAPFPGDTELTFIEVGSYNSNIVDFLNSEPDYLGVEGPVTVGDGYLSGTLRSQDFIFGRLTFSSPMACSLGADTMSLKPRHVWIKSARDFLEENMQSVKIHLAAENHLPIGMGFSVFFGADSTETYENPFLRVPEELRQFDIAPGIVGAAGTVVESVTDTIEIELTQDQARLFDRDDAYVGLLLYIPGTETAVSFRATDYVRVTGLVEIILKLGDE